MYLLRCTVQENDMLCIISSALLGTIFLVSHNYFLSLTSQFKFLDHNFIRTARACSAASRFLRLQTASSR